MRVKRGTVKRQKHSEILKKAKGYRLTYSKLYRRAREALLHAGQYSYAHRKRRRSDKRRQWISTISAGLTGSGVSYSQFMHGMKQNNISLDRKVLATIAEKQPNHFAEIVKAAAA